jgi:hypothetical protein
MAVTLNQPMQPTKNKKQYRDPRADSREVVVKQTPRTPGGVFPDADGFPEKRRGYHQTTKAIDTFLHATKGIVHEATMRRRFESRHKRAKRKRKTLDQFHKKGGKA